MAIKLATRFSSFFAQRISEIGVLYKTDYDAHCMPARLSGDEFVIYINASARHGNIAHKFSDTLLAPLQKGFITESGNYPITVSLGIATYPNDGHSIEKAAFKCRHCDVPSNEQGKNRYADYLQT